MTKIIVVNNSFPPYEGRYKDCLVLGFNNWDDYGYKTTFSVHYSDDEGHVKSIGTIKIYTSELELEESSGKTYMYLDDEINHLGENFCSLGQDLNYYKEMQNIFPDTYMEILSRLRDIAVDKIICEAFRGYLGVNRSLLRESGAVKALSEVIDILNKDEMQNDLSFGYRFQIPYSSIDTEIDFNFRKKDYFPFRVNVIAGKNGTGKTILLTKLADSISGYSKKPSFVGERPNFAKVMSVSYSYFDNFKKRNSIGSYVYCGIQTEEGPLSKEQLTETLKSAIEKIKKGIDLMIGKKLYPN